MNGSGKLPFSEYLGFQSNGLEFSKCQILAQTCATKWWKKKWWSRSRIPRKDLKRMSMPASWREFLGFWFFCLSGISRWLAWLGKFKATQSSLQFQKWWAEILDTQLGLTGIGRVNVGLILVQCWDKISLHSLSHRGCHCRMVAAGEVLQPSKSDPSTSKAQWHQQQSGGAYFCIFVIFMCTSYSSFWQKFAYFRQVTCQSLALELEKPQTAQYTGMQHNSWSCGQSLGLLPSRWSHYLDSDF